MVTSMKSGMSRERLTGVQDDVTKGRRIMRTLISAFAGLVLLAGGVVPQYAMADVQTPQPQRTIYVTAGQGGSLAVVLPATTGELTNAGPAQEVAVTAGQAGSINVVVPGPSLEVVAAKASTNGAGEAKVTLQPTEGIN
jgi:hypothetical protein